MRTTASYDLFPDAPSERAMARARWLAREGRVADAEDAYRGVLATHPDLKPCWAEYFELLRRSGRRDDALQLAGRALAQFGATGFALALEPNTETLRLRGRILRAAGRYPAAEVAFEGAAQAAEHPEQREEAEREILATRRYAFYAPRRPDQLAPAEEWFAQTGVAVLAPDPGPVAPSDDTLVATLLEVAGDRGWQVGQIVVVGPSLPVWNRLAEAWDTPLVGRTGLDPRTAPLVVALRPLPADAAWQQAVRTVEDHQSGLVFVLEHPAELTAPPQADVVGVLTDLGVRRERMPNPVQAMTEVQHPAARAAGRRLHPV